MKCGDDNNHQTWIGKQVNGLLWFQVNKVLRNHNIKPHWMFALDNIIRKAVQTAITILVPGRAPRISCQAPLTLSLESNDFASA